MCLYAFILHHTEMLMLSFNLRQLIWSLGGGLLFSAQTFFFFFSVFYFFSPQTKPPQFRMTPLK